jgi:hypothetical protein
MDALWQRIYALEYIVKDYIREQNQLSIILVQRVLELERRLREIQAIEEPGRPIPHGS